MYHKSVCPAVCSSASSDDRVTPSLVCVSMLAPMLGGLVLCMYACLDICVQVRERAVWVFVFGMVN